MSLAQTLAAAIDVWMSEKKSRNLKMLARQSTVSYATVRRIAQSEGEPGQEVAMKIAQVVMKDHEFRVFVEQYAPSLKRYWADVVIKRDDPEMLEYLEDERYVPVILLSSHSQGTNEDEVRDMFGRDAVKYFMDLVNSGHLVQVGRNWRLEKNIASLSLDTARSWLAKMTTICPMENDEKRNVSAAHVGWESVNAETANEVFRLVCECMRSVVSLVSQEKNKGDILLFYGSLFNVLKNAEKGKQ